MLILLFGCTNVQANEISELLYWRVKIWRQLVLLAELETKERD
jgi:hypothetical protein